MNTRFKEIRKNLNLKQHELASALNLSTSAICDYERGRRRITERTINDLCLKFNINKDWFLTGNGSMFNDVTNDPDFENFSDMTKDILKKVQYLPEKDQRLILTMINQMFEETEKK